MTDKKKDLRFRKTELSIRAAFFELLKSRRISEITVAEISRKAMLGRGTFYLHYKDIHDLLDTLENEYVEAIGNIIDEYYPIAPAANISELTENCSVTSPPTKNSSDFSSTIFPHEASSTA